MLTVFLDQACRVVAKDTFGWIPELDTCINTSISVFHCAQSMRNFAAVKALTALEGAVVVTQVMAAEAPTQALQLFVQHLCQPYYKT